MGSVSEGREAEEGSIGSQGVRYGWGGTLCSSSDRQPWAVILVTWISMVCVCLSVNMHACTGMQMS